MISQWNEEQQDRAPLGAVPSIRSSAVFQNFKYIKTFTPIRRPTTSYAATIRQSRQIENREGRIVADDLTARMLNRSFMVDPWDRLLSGQRPGALRGRQAESESHLYRPGGVP